MPVNSYVPAGYMFSFIILALVVIAGIHLNESTRSQINRMSLGYSVAHKPYSPVKPDKPKKPKNDFRLLMARGKYAGSGLVGLSGKIQGTVFLSNNVVRVWRKPNNVRNAATQFVRGIFSGTSTAWKTLTASEISSWITAAPLYFSKKVFATAYALKGNTLFQRVNNTLTSLGLANITTAPGIATPGFVITSAVAAAAAGAATFGVTITEFSGQVVLPAHSYIKVYATRQVDIGRSSFGLSQYRLIGAFDPTASTNPLDIEADYVAKFGALVAGQRIGIAMEVTTYIATAPGSFTNSGKFFVECVVAA